MTEVQLLQGRERLDVNSRVETVPRSAEKIDRARSAGSMVDDRTPEVGEFAFREVSVDTRQDLVGTGESSADIY